MGNSISIFRNRIIMKVFVIVAIFVAVLDGRRQREEPVPMAGCDPDFGWVDGADGSGKCYQLIKDVTFARCGVDAYEQGMSWFQAMECCYYNKGYLAEPQNIQENDKIMEYIKVADGMDGGLTAYWLGQMIFTEKESLSTQVVNLLPSQTGWMENPMIQPERKIVSLSTVQSNTSGWI